MDSLCNYGSDEDQSQSNSKPSLNNATDRHIEQDVNYEPITMDMSEDSNEEEYYARKYGKYADVAAAAQAQRFDPYEDDVSDAPTSPEPDPPTGSHERDPKLTLTAQQDSRDQSQNGTRQNQFGGNNTKIDEFGRTCSERTSSSEQTRRNNERGGEASQPKQHHGYGSYYERAKRKMSGGDEEEEYGQYDESGSYGNNTSYPASASSGGNSHFPSSQQQNRSKDRSHYDQQDTNRRSHDRSKTSRYERDRSQEKDRRSRERSSRERGGDRSSRERGGDSWKEKDRKTVDKKKRKRSRSRSRDRKHDRKSSRRYRSSRSHSRSSRSRSRSSSRHHSSRHSKDRRRSSDRDRRSSDRDRRHGSSSSRRDRDRRDREPSMGDLPRPYAPYERKPNKLQILEKLGIELKVSDQPSAPGQSPQVIAVSKAAPNTTGIHNIPPLMSTPITLGGLVPGGTVGNSGVPGVTPQDLLQKTIAAQVEKIKADTGIELPKYYNPMAINPTKYAEQIQKRRLLWGNKQSSTTTSTTITTITQSQVTTSSQSTTSMPADSTAGGGAGKPSGTIWQGATFSGDQDGRLTNKFQRLMGMKHAGVTVSSTTPANDPSNDRKAATTSSSSSSSGATGSGGSDLIKKQEEMFNSMESQYEAARLATHTHRGLGLGFGTFAPR